MRGRICRFAIVFTAALLSAAPVPTSPLFAQSTQPAGQFEDRPVRVGAATGSKFEGPTTAPASAALAPTISFNWPRVALALGTVIGLILLMRFAGKRWLGASAAVGAGKVVRVLGRATTGPRQQVVLIQIGRRIVVAADNAGQMSSLCQITEADEVASLLGQLEETTSAAPAMGFAKWFKRAETDFDDADADEGLVRAGAVVISPTSSRSSEDPSLEHARGEIASLMDKVRGLGKQFRK